MCVVLMYAWLCMYVCRVRVRGRAVCIGVCMRVRDCARVYIFVRVKCAYVVVGMGVQGMRQRHRQPRNQDPLLMGCATIVGGGGMLTGRRGPRHGCITGSTAAVDLLE